MSVPRPIVRCVNESDRRALRAELWHMGFCGGCFSSPERVVTGFSVGDYVTTNGNACQDAMNEMPPSDGRYTLVNSPAHMLAYIRRHNLAPKAHTPDA